MRQTVVHYIVHAPLRKRNVPDPRKDDYDAEDDRLMYKTVSQKISLAFEQKSAYSSFTMSKI